MAIHTVGIVVNRNFGDQLLEIARRIHVWVCDTPVNRPVVERLSQMQQPGEWNEWGATVFRVSDDDSPEDMVIGVLSAVDRHHDEHSHDPPWSQIEIYGVEPTPRLREALQEYGVDDFRETPGGFVCSRVLEELDLEE
ncbi:MAG: hypothetical protein M3Y13_04970 [Armatimonadota bacterium]|nr:hypothetical protein [Armatimonadota bacterium]